MPKKVESRKVESRLWHASSWRAKLCRAATTAMLVLSMAPVRAEHYAAEGKLLVEQYSGQACPGQGLLAGDQYEFEVVIELMEGGEVRGYVDGPKLDQGRFTGALGKPIPLELTRIEASNTTGHNVTIQRRDNLVEVQIQEKEAAPGSGQCNLRMARFAGQVQVRGIEAKSKFDAARDQYARTVESLKAYRRDPDAFGKAAALTRKAEQLAKEKKPAEASAAYAERHPLYVTLFGAEHVKIFESLEAWADQSEDAEQLDKAVALQQEALTLAGKIFKAEPGKIASAASTLVRLQLANGQFTQALPNARTALELTEALNGPDHVDIARQLNVLGRVYSKLARLDEALPLYRRALAISEKQEGQDHQRTGIRLNDLASALQDLGRFDEALPLAQRALGIAEKVHGPEHRDTAVRTGNLATLLEAMGRYAEALPLYRRALSIYEKVRGPEHSDTALALGNLGNALKLTGNNAEALPLQQRALAIARKVFGQNHIETAHHLNNLAGLQADLGQYAAALESYQQALKVVEDRLGPAHPRTAIQLNNLAALQAALGQLDLALDLSRRALKISEQTLGPEHPTTATRLSNLALYLESAGQLETAVGLLQRSIAITAKAEGPEHINMANRQNNLGHALVSMERLDEALPVYQQALRISENVRGVGHQDSSTIRNNLATTLVRLKRAMEAVPLAQQSYDAAAVSNSPLARFLATRTLAFVQYGAGEKDLAIIYAKLAVNIMQTVRSDSAGLSPTQRRGLLTENQTIYHSLVKWLIAAGRLAEAEQVMGMLKDQELYQLIQRNSGNARASISFSEGETAVLAKLQIKSDSTALAIQASQSSADLMRAVLGKSTRTASLSYIVTEDSLSIILTTSKGSIAAQQPLKTGALAKQIDAFRMALGNPRIDPRPQAQALYKVLIAPVADELKESGADTLSLSLTDVLRYIPFGALHDGQGYLVERFALALFTPAGGVKVEAPDVRQWRVAGMGLTQAISGFSALPSVSTELASIVRTPGSPDGAVAGTLALDMQFDRAWLQTALKDRFPALHLASHFHFTPGSERLSYLLLGNGEKFTLAELKQLDFNGVQLLALSACNTATGGGYGESGAEVEGLGAAVQLAGAQSVLASLWEVSDNSTALLMQSFYRLRTAESGGANARNAAQAMREAQLALIEGRPISGLPPSDKALRGASSSANGGARDNPDLPRYTPDPKAPYAHPFFWAPFILMGNWL